MQLLEGRAYVSLSLNLWCLTCSRNKSLDISGKNPSKGKEGHTQDMVKQPGEQCFSDVVSNSQPLAG